MDGEALRVSAVIKRSTGRIAVRVEPRKGIDLQFIYRAGLSVYWCSAEALLEDRGSTVESSESSSGRIARALREEYGMALQPLGDVQWSGVSAEEQDRIAAALFDRSR